MFECQAGGTWIEAAGLRRTLGKPVEWDLIERLESLEKNMEAAAAARGR